MLSRSRTGWSQAGQADPGRTTESPAGTRCTTTVRNEPTARPRAAIVATTTPVFACVFALVAAAPAMAWAFAAHPEWQERAREEVLALGLADDEPLTREHLGALTAIDVVMKECMRMWPPVPANLRKSVVDTSIDGYHIPKGTWLNVHQPETHRMEEYWEKPNDFDPSRFLPPREEHKVHSHAYLPFGGGVHKCIGLYFAGAEIKTILHQLLRTHRWSVDASYVAPLDYHSLPYPRDGQPIDLERLVEDHTGVE